MLKKLFKMVLVSALLFGAYRGYVRGFALVVNRLTSARKVDGFKFVVHESHSQKEAIRRARESFGLDHWTAREDLQLRYYNGERGFWMYSQHDERIIEEDGVRYDGRRIRLTPAAIIWQTKDGSSTKTVTADVATIDFNQPLSLNIKPNSEPLVVKYARLERNVMIRDDKGTPGDQTDDMVIGPLTYVDYDDDALQIRSDSDVLIVDRDTRTTSQGFLIQLRPKSEPVPGGRASGFEGAQYAKLNKNVNVLFQDVGKTGFLPGSAQAEPQTRGQGQGQAQAQPKPQVQAQGQPQAKPGPRQAGARNKAPAEPVPLDVHCDGAMLVELPKPRARVKVGPPAPPGPTMVHFTRNVVVRRGQPAEQPDRLESDNLDLTLVPAESPEPATNETATAKEAEKPRGMFGDLTLDRVKATGHAVWLHQPSRGAKIGCNEMIHEAAPRGGQNVTYFRIDSLRKHWLLEKYDFVEERPQGQNGPVSRKPESVTHVWASDATLFDSGGDMERADLVARGPGRMETRPVSTAAAALREGVPADRIVTWQKQLVLKKEVRPGTKTTERVLILTGKPWVFDRLQQSSLKTADTIVAWLEPKPADSQGAPASSGVAGGPARRSGDAKDGGFQIRRLLARDDAHLVAPSKNLIARRRLDVSFIQPPRPAVAASRPAPETPRTAPPAGPDPVAGQERPEPPPAREKAPEPPMIAQADSVEATIVVNANPNTPDRSANPNPPDRSAAGLAGGSDSSYEIRDAQLFGNVRLHQDPSPGKTKGQDATGEALVLRNEGPGTAVFNLYNYDPRVKKAEGQPAAPRKPLAQVITEDQTIKGERIGVNQKTDEAWVYGAGELVQLTDRNLMTDKSGDGQEAQSAANGAGAVKPKPRTRAGKVLSDRVPLTITWQDRMLFHGRSVDPENHPSAKAQFFKNVVAQMEDGLLYAQDVTTTYTDRPIPLADVGKLKRRKESAGEDDAESEEPKPDLTLIQLVGKAQAISRKVDPDRPVLLSRQRITGDTIIYDRRTGDFQVPSEGVVYLYDRGDNGALPTGPTPNGAIADRRPIRPTAAGPEDRPGRKAASPAAKGALRPLVLTQIQFKKEMKGRFGTGRDTDKTAARWADFFGDIETARAIVSDERKILDYDRLPPDAYFLTSQTMRVVTEPPPAGSPANAPARNFLKAWENAFARTNDTTISADVITYDSKNDLVYANGQEGRLVQVVRQSGIGQQGSQTVGQAVRVNPKTGAADVIGPRDLQWVDTRTGTRPRPVAPPDPNAKPPKKPKRPFQEPRSSIERRGFTGQ